MRKLLVTITVAATALLAPLPAAADPGADSRAVTPWIETALDTIASTRTNPPRASRALAMLSVAMHEAAAAANGRPAERAAVAGAASTVLSHLYPNQAERFHGLAQKMRGPNRPGFRLGVAIARDLIAERAGDGSAAVWTGALPSGPGLWVPTPPAFVSPPLEPLWGSVQTWNLASALIAPPPTAFGSAEYAAETQEVYDVSQSLTPAQAAIALHWADGPGTVTPPGHWNQIALDVIAAQSLSAEAAAEILAALNTAQADSFISCWATKYYYWTERPVTAIRREIDASWLSLIATPPFPSYVSGHSSTSGTASAVLASYFPAAAAQLQAWANEAAVSRLYGGIHFRSDNDAGLALGREVAIAAIAAWRCDDGECDDDDDDD